MITKLSIANFRSLKDVSLPLSKINVLTGGNNSGKSSVIYALLTLVNFVKNPKQSLNSLFDYHYINLGKFKNVVHLKEVYDNIKIEIFVDSDYDELTTRYALELGEVSKVSLKVNDLSEFQQNITFPYDLELEKYTVKNEKEGDLFSIFWNGVTNQSLKIKNLDETKLSFSVNTNHVDLAESQILNAYNSPFSHLIKTDFIPFSRGFSKPYYAAIPLSGFHVTEEEIATVIATSNIASKISYYLEKIIGKSFNVHQEVGTAVFYLQIRDIDTPNTNYLVNEGTGTGQLVTILAKALIGNNKFICIDEPEIHLHPTIISKLVAALLEIAETEKKQFLVSTHSEPFVVALMHQVADKKIAPNDVNVFYLSKDGNETNIEQQRINDKGQIEGGLMGFYEEEIKSIKDYFKLK